jgi:hypothetical protein
MHRKLMRVSVSLLLILVSSKAAVAATNKDIVDAFSEFLIDRANANLTAVFERRLKDDKNFQCYFPETYKKIDSISLENLFAEKNYWDDSLGKDLQALIYRSILVEAQQGLGYLDSDKIIEAMQYLDYEYKGKRYPINTIPLDAPEDLREQINGFSYKLVDALIKIDKREIHENVCQVKETDKNELKKKLESYLLIGNDLVSWSEHVAKYGKNLRLTSEGKQKLFCSKQNISAAACETASYDEKALIADLLGSNDPEKIKKAVNIANRIKQAYDAYDVLDQKQLDAIDKAIQLLPLLETANFTANEIKKAQELLREAKNASGDKRADMLARVVASIKQHAKTDDPDAQHISDMLRVIVYDKEPYTDRALVALSLLKGSELFDSASQERLSKSVMFFASIADAQDKEAVKAILAAYVLPPVSYAEKRKLGEGFFITSYFGVAASSTNIHHSSEEASKGGLFVPVGVEYNHGFSGGSSLSVMLSPFDFAYPVNLKLNGITDNYDVKEIVSPSVTIAYGIKDYPLNIGLGYQQGRKLNDVNKAETRILLFVSFDMPLFRLY